MRLTMAQTRYSCILFFLFALVAQAVKFDKMAPDTAQSKPATHFIIDQQEQIRQSALQ